ncbi:hypothetical protein SMALB_7621 [Streptomyces malaysiensis]|uniref:Uncharacterized protein n=1 Tax=Streptomyces malaysiensis TaxID=92644 RepID=A0A7X5XAK1_STRMQ|nr:hypothetical protein [Streptomyces malaysiensis]
MARYSWSAEDALCAMGWLPEWIETDQRTAHVTPADLRPGDVVLAITPDDAHHGLCITVRRAICGETTWFDYGLHKVMTARLPRSRHSVHARLQRGKRTGRQPPRNLNDQRTAHSCLTPTPREFQERRIRFRITDPDTGREIHPGDPLPGPE